MLIPFLLAKNMLEGKFQVLLFLSPIKEVTMENTQVRKKPPSGIITFPVHKKNMKFKT